MPRWTLLLLLIFGPFSFAFAENFVFSYDSLRKRILTQHPSIRNSQYDIDIAQDRQKLAEYTRYPRFNLRFGGFPYVPYLYMSSGGMRADWNQWGPAFALGVDTWIPIYDFGVSSNLEKAALFNKQASESAFEIVKQDVLFQVKQLYWNYLAYNTVKKYIFDVVSPEFDELVKKNERNFTRGQVSRNTLEQSRVDNLTLKKEFSTLQRQRKSLDGQLNLLLSRNATDSPLSINFQVKYLYPLPLELKPYSYYLSIARHNNPYLKKMFNDAQAAQYYAAAQKSGIWPKIGFYLNASYTMLEFNRKADYYSDVYPDRGWKFGFGFALNWGLNVWDHLVNYDLHNKSYLKTLELSKQADQEIENRLQQSYNDLEHKNTLLNYEKEILTITQRNFIFTKRAQDSGNTTSEDVSDTLRKLFYELKNYYSQILSFNMAIASFERLLNENISDYPKAEQKQIQDELFLQDTEE